MRQFIKIVPTLAVLCSVFAAPAFASGGNLVSNGDFSLGHTQFKSDYSFHGYGTNDPNKGTGHDKFELGPDPKVDNNTWASVGDHTTGTGNFMLVDGSTTGTARVWYETFNVVKGQKYNISAWAVNFLNKAPARLIVTLNGSQKGPGLVLQSTPGTWQNLNFDWVSNTTKVTFAIVDTHTASSGNDFGLDDISFKPVPEASTVVTFALLFIGGLLTLRKRARTNATAS